MMKMKVTAESSQETTTATESPNPRSKSLYITHGMRTITLYGRTAHPFMKKEDGGGDSLLVDDDDDDIVNMGVFELNSQVYMIAGKRTSGKTKDEDLFSEPIISSDAVYVIDRKDQGDNETLHLCRTKDVHPLPSEFCFIPFMVKIKGEIYVLHPAGYSVAPEKTFFVLGKSYNFGGNSWVWKWKSLPPPPFYLHTQVYPYIRERANVMGVVGTRLWVDTNEGFCFYDVETEAWGWGHIPDEFAFNPVTLSITASSADGSRNYVVICTGGYVGPYHRSSYLHAVLVSELGEVLCYQVIDDVKQGLPLSSDSPYMYDNIRVVELECDGGNCSTFGVLYCGHSTLFVQVWTVSLLMETGIGSSNTTSGMISTNKRMDVETTIRKVRPLDYFCQVERAVSKQFLVVKPKEQRTYKWHDELTGASHFYYGRSNMFFK